MEPWKGVDHDFSRASPFFISSVKKIFIRSNETECECISKTHAYLYVEPYIGRTLRVQRV